MKLGHWIGLLVLVIALYIVWEIRQLLLLLFAAIALATALNQLVEWFQHHRLQRLWAVTLTMVMTVGTLWLFLGLIVPPFIRQFEQLVDLLPIALAQLEEGINWVEDQILTPYFPDIVDFSALIRQLQPVSQDGIGQLLDFFSTSVNALLQLLLTFVLTVMLLSNPCPYRKGFIRLFPGFYRQRAEQILSQCQVALERWSGGALIEMGFIAILSAIGLWILQVPLVLAHALLAGLLNFIPNIGPTLSVILPMAVALLDAPWKAIAVLILYIVIQQIESYWLTPTIMAKQVALLPAVTLMAQIVFASLFGALGLIVALPLTVVAKVWIQEVLLNDVLDHWQQATAHE